ncbi:MAG: hypothetical protein A3E84_00815 [Gammaproteobacteria bacterium RIFCSPHIGHO2_12_FULL_42_13]|nr:MAG: hypothetical protein A3E84_00815 [Gammaproteobacteria bacterium RIFCSPHIGHO2_12_FULL_42_13]
MSRSTEVSQQEIDHVEALAPPLVDLLKSNNYLEFLEQAVIGAQNFKMYLLRNKLLSLEVLRGKISSGVWFFVVPFYQGENALKKFLEERKQASGKSHEGFFKEIEANYQHLRALITNAEEFKKTSLSNLLKRCLTELWIVTMMARLNEGLAASDYVRFYFSSIGLIHEQKGAVINVKLTLSPDKLLKLSEVVERQKEGIWFFLLILPKETCEKAIAAVLDSLPKGDRKAMVGNLMKNNELLAETISKLSELKEPAVAENVAEFASWLILLLRTHQVHIDRMIKKTLASNGGTAQEPEQSAQAAPPHRYTVFFNARVIQRDAAEKAPPELQEALAKLLDSAIQEATMQGDVQTITILRNFWIEKIMRAPTLNALIKLFTIDASENGDLVNGHPNCSYSDGKFRSIIEDFTRNDIPADLPKPVVDCIRACCDTIADFLSPSQCLNLSQQTGNVR